MKAKKLTSIIAVPIIAGASLLSGCMSNDAFTAKLLEIKYERKAEIATPKEHIPEVSEKIYRKSQVFEENQVTQETVNKLVESPIWKHYQNRDKN